MGNLSVLPLSSRQVPIKLSASPSNVLFYPTLVKVDLDEGETMNSVPVAASSAPTKLIVSVAESNGMANVYFTKRRHDGD